VPFGAAQALLAITIATAIRVIFFIHSSPLLDVNVPPRWKAHAGSDPSLLVAI
jgi:hypothetical protein